MDIEQVRVARREMENTICEAVASAVEAFHTKTRQSPQGISIFLVDVTTVGECEKRYTVGEVRADVRL